MDELSRSGSDHILRNVDQKLALVAEKVVGMGAITETMLADAVQAMMRGDCELADRVRKRDRELDRIQAEIEGDAVAFIATHQPVARDLREAVAALRISGDLERCGDLAKNIAKRVGAIETGQAVEAEVLQGLATLSDVAGTALTRVMEAYAKDDVGLADTVWRSDAQVDIGFTNLFRDLIARLMQHPDQIGTGVHILFCAKNIERFGDHATNIAEAVAFRAGESPGSSVRPKRDDSVYAVFRSE